VNAELRNKVLAVYAEVDAAIASAKPRCDASGRCCKFVEWGHRLYLSHFEAELLLETAPAYARPVGQEGCPFQIDGLCTARDGRPLGCRIYFCDPNFQEPQYELTERALGKLKRLAEEYDTGWEYASLQHFLNAAPERVIGGDGRRALPMA